MPTYSKVRNGEKVKQISTFLPLLLVLSLLQGCGGGGGSTQNTVRFVNGVSGVSASTTLNMVTGGTVLASAVPYGGASGYTTLTSGTYTMELENTGTTTLTAATNFSFAAGTPYTLLAYVSDPYTSGQGTLHLAQLIDNQPAPTYATDGWIRVMDLAADAGNLDVYWSTDVNTADDVYTPGAVSTALNAALPLFSTVAGTTGYLEIPQNTYHIWVTGAGDKTDLRLDIPSITLSAQQILTVVLTGTSGGALVDGLLVNQQSSVAAKQNGNARIRLAASSTTTITAATAGSSNTPLLGTASSFTSNVGTYALVPYGSTAITLNGSVVCTPVTSNGQDMTILVTGAASTCNPLIDDNTLPPAGYAKMRLVNGVNGGSAVTLYNNYLPITTAVAVGTASDPTTNFNQGIVEISVPAILTTSPNVYSTTSALQLNSQGVYSMFLMGSSGSVTGILNRDH